MTRLEPHILARLRARAKRSPPRIHGSWAGRRHGVRKPEENETPLSWSEIMHGMRAGLV